MSLTGFEISLISFALIFVTVASVVRLHKSTNNKFIRWFGYFFIGMIDVFVFGFCAGFVFFFNFG